MRFKPPFVNGKSQIQNVHIVSQYKWLAVKPKSGETT